LIGLTDLVLDLVDFLFVGIEIILPFVLLFEGEGDYSKIEIGLNE
jgi:hypothetical protein